MKKYSVRPASPRDLETVYASIAAQNLNDLRHAIITPDSLQKRWQGIHFETRTCMAYTDGELESYAELQDGVSPSFIISPKKTTST